MSENYAENLVGQIAGGVAALVVTAIACYGLTKYVDWKLAKLEKK